MSTVRAQIADALTDALPTNYRVLPYGTELDGISTGGVAVMVRRDRVAPGATQSLLNNEMSIILAVPNVDPERADDALDEALDEVLDILTPLNLLSWSAAERAVLDESFPAYEITCTVTTQKD